MLLFRNILILAGQCGMDKIFNLFKLLNQSKHIIVRASQKPWTRPERQIKNGSVRCFIQKNIFI